MECDKCNKLFHVHCVEEDAVELPFWYCDKCGGNEKEPTMNKLLLKCLMEDRDGVQTLI